MNTESNGVMVAKATSAAVVALVVTWLMSWSFVDCDHVTDNICI